MKTRQKVQVILFYRDAHNNKFFLLLKTSEKRGSFWQNVTGGVDIGESYKDAAIRELLEETSIAEDQIIKLHSSDLEFNFHDQWGYDVTEKVYFVETTKNPSILLDKTEHQDYKWVSNLKRDLVKFESNFISLEEANKLN